MTKTAFIPPSLTAIMILQRSSPLPFSSPDSERHTTNTAPIIPILGHLSSLGARPRERWTEYSSSAGSGSNFWCGEDPHVQHTHNTPTPAIAIVFGLFFYCKCCSSLSLVFNVVWRRPVRAQPSSSVRVIILSFKKQIKLKPTPFVVFITGSTHLELRSTPVRLGWFNAVEGKFHFYPRPNVREFALPPSLVHSLPHATHPPRWLLRHRSSLLALRNRKVMGMDVAPERSALALALAKYALLEREAGRRRSPPAVRLRSSSSPLLPLWVGVGGHRRGLWRAIEEVGTGVVWFNECGEWY
ncbi:hypothetical protein C8F04DRAFT_1186125 [Mycena alexandri]|uniref:Uncharacterized protein n=1 Tax=Mycena alexandri TaxID=1745969 RepID=A0AAD6SPK5_9AGAR|nr:hypothetical protein C8F04DRAFT_1186125 [Mycena alexandri]